MRNSCSRVGRPASDRSVPRRGQLLVESTRIPHSAKKRMNTTKRGSVRLARCLAITIACLTSGMLSGAGAAEPAPAKSKRPVDYNRDVRPILAANCYVCHGPDKKERKAGLRLDLKESAFAALKSGAFAIKPGDAKASALVHRITSRDPDEVMPPPASGKSVTPAQIDTIRGWIEQGAEWKQHWVYVPPVRAEAPKVKTQELVAWCDRSIHSRAP